jgi:hypothetical protein
MLEFPQIVRVSQTFAATGVVDPAAAVARELAALHLEERIRRGDTVAITAGSRGIAHIASITRAIVDHIRGLGAQPCIIPAMGSHGGATVAGQLAILAGYGITEETMGCPIRATMDTTVVTHAAAEFPIHIDRLACEADHVIVCNRIKPHTSIAGRFESGLMKMLLIGLGKETGASTIHRAMVDWSFDQIVNAVGADVIAKVSVVAGVAVVENALEETALVAGMRGADILDREPALLEQARRWMARLPFDELDLLIVDRMGKNISGTGIDTNVVGRKSNDHEARGDERPRIKRIAVRGLTDETRGNALGIGIAEFCRDRLLDQLDRRKTQINSLTSLHPTGAMLPLSFANDREMLEAALGTIGLRAPDQARIAWIRDTLHLSELACSTALVDELSPHAQCVGAPIPLPLDRDGNLPDSFFG